MRGTLRGLRFESALHCSVKRRLSHFDRPVLMLSSSPGAPGGVHGGSLARWRCRGHRPQAKPGATGTQWHHDAAGRRRSPMRPRNRAATGGRAPAGRGRSVRRARRPPHLAHWHPIRPGPSQWRLCPLRPGPGLVRSPVSGWSVLWSGIAKERVANRPVGWTRREAKAARACARSCMHAHLPRLQVTVPVLGHDAH